MCKVMMVAGLKPKTIEPAKKLMDAAAKIFGRTDSDGTGYAAITKSGQIYGEKWLNHTDAFKISSNPPPDPIAKYMSHFFEDAAKFKNEPNSEKIYDSFGELNQETINDTVAVILHARKATIGSKNILNVHPFVEMDGGFDVPVTAMIHNGSINNHDKLTKKYSTCDSETIIHEYLKNQMYYNPWAITDLAKTLIGQYTVGVLSSIPYEDGNNQPILDIFKSNKDLYAAYVNELETIVFCTTEYTLTESVKDAGLTLSNLVEVKDGFLLRIDAITGERLEDTIKFDLSKERESYSYYQGGSASSETKAPTTSHMGNTTVSRVRPSNAKVIKEDETVEDVKVNFTKHHPDLFSTPYYDIDDTLSDDEKKLYKELEQNNTTNHKALYLVKSALGY